MTPQDLTEDEALTLICLVRQMVVADGQVSVAELAQMHEIGGKLGTDMYSRVADLVEKQPATIEHAITRAASLLRPEARDLVWGLIIDVADADGIDDTEQDLLNLLKEVWGR